MAFGLSTHSLIQRIGYVTNEYGDIYLKVSMDCCRLELWFKRYPRINDKFLKSYDEQWMFSKRVEEITHDILATRELELL